MLFGVPRTKKAAAVIWCRTIRAVLRKTVAYWRFILACWPLRAKLTGGYYTIKQVKFQVNS
jgi:hypothetical protein